MYIKFHPIEIIKNILFIVVIAIILQLIITYGNGAMPFAIVEGHSMDGTLSEGDVVFWYPSDMHSIRVGDVIVFKSYIKNGYVIHRVVGITYVNEEIAFITKGDANDYTDQQRGESPVTKDNLVGKVVTLDSTPLRVPWIGILGLKFNDFKDYLAKTIWGRHTPMEDSIIYFIIGSAVVAISLFTSKPPLKRYLYMGIEKFDMKKIFAMVFVIIIALSFIPMFMLSQQQGIALGVNKSLEGKQKDLNFDYMKWNSSKTAIYYIYDPCILPIRTVVYTEGNASKFLKYDYSYTISAGSGKTQFVNAKIPEGEKNGTYFAKMHIYSSFFWTIFPEDFVIYLIKINPFFAMIIMNIISSFIITIFILLIMLLADIIALLYLSSRYELRYGSVLGRKTYGYSWDLIHKLRAIKKIFQKVFIWLTVTDGKNVNLKNIWPFVFGGIVFTVVCINDGLILPIIYGSVILSIISFLLITRKRAEIFFGNFIFASIPIIFFAVKTSYLADSYFVVLATFSILYLITIFILLILSIAIIKLITFIGKSVGFIIYDY